MPVANSNHAWEVVSYFTLLRAFATEPLLSCFALRTESFMGMTILYLN